jgi:hypothetical protein
MVFIIMIMLMVSGILSIWKEYFWVNNQVAFDAIYAQVKKEKKASRWISRSSRTSMSSRIRLATSPSQLPVVGCLCWLRFDSVYFDLYYVHDSCL